MTIEAQTPPSPQAADGETTTPAATERGTYELIRDRLLSQARRLGEQAAALNQKRLELFGGTELQVIGNQRIRTENNCIPRDIAQLGDRLLFGYNVFIGLKKETAVADVFSCHRFFANGDGGFSFEPCTAEHLADAKFVSDFQELYAYFKGTRLLQLRRLGDRLLAIFQVGATPHDIKVLRWSVDPEGAATYVDNRGERDHVFAPAHDFEWTPTGREQHVFGRHPHVDVLGKVFVETVGGDLTVKVEDNTEDGWGIYREPVEDPDQSLDDGEVHYAELGPLILLKILPYREQAWRYLIFNTRTRQVDRIDAIGLACHQLPEDHGLIFPGGYYLPSGETKTYDERVDDLELVRRIRSPNGEDVLYVFHHRDQGRFLLLPYNMIRKQVPTVIQCHGYSLFPNGHMVIFRAESDEPTRVHAMQIWQTPFMSDEVAAQAARAETGSFLENVGNAELVRGISDCLALARSVEEQRPSVATYEELIATAGRALDAYYWLDHQEVGDLRSTVEEMRSSAELIVDEFEKVEAIRRQARSELERAEAEVEALIDGLVPEAWSSADEYVGALGELRTRQGHLITLRDLRYVDRERLDRLEARVVAELERLGALTVELLLGEEALAPYLGQIDELIERVDQVEKVAEAQALGTELEVVDERLQLLTEVVGGLETDDATVRTRLLEGISEVLGGLNRARALLDGKRRSLRSHEAVAEFGAEFKVFSQSVTGALNMADSPEKCDTALARLMLVLEELEGRFSDFDEFLTELTTKREEVYEAISSKKQLLLDQRQRRVEQMLEAGGRILDSVRRRALGFASDDELNAFFASDPMVAKVRDLAERLRKLENPVKADELEGAVKAARQEAARALRDRSEIFEEGAEILKLGRHRFSVNTQPLALTVVPRDDGMYFHLTATDYYQRVEDEAFAETRPYWQQSLVSETPEVYRCEYLAAEILHRAEAQCDGLSLERLHQSVAGISAAGQSPGGAPDAKSPGGPVGAEGLLGLVRGFASERYDEGYERGVHDVDAARILERLLSVYSSAGLLRFPSPARTLGLLYWILGPEGREREGLERRGRSLARLRSALAPSPAIGRFVEELRAGIERLGEELGLERLGFGGDPALAAAYLFEELGRERTSFVTHAGAERLREDFRNRLRSSGQDRHFEEDLRQLEAEPAARLALARAWLEGFVDAAGRQQEEHLVDETAVLLAFERAVSRTTSSAQTAVVVDSLLGQHPRIDSGRLELRLDAFLARLDRFRRQRVPGFRAFQAERHALLERQRERLRLDEFRPQVMSSFVRNRLINDVYLPLIGDNLAKQIGAVGEGKRTDLMGLLLLISPPGYGKTTLMEYVANRLGLVFMKINGPALGHAVTSLDPGEAPNVTARQEVEKINLALEMGNNVLLYLDDIQHTSSELLQKFISLCDAQRKVEGVWQGRTRTYDLRGKRFCVCMAGNPYTESGERFRIPDMLANRADTYNLGDILEGREELFALSYLENALTSSPFLAPLAGREPEDVYKLVRMARGESVQTDELAHPYSAVELQEIRAVLVRLLRVQQVLLLVNQQYIRSASQADAYRTEPPFQLQGSYRNMSRLAEKIVPVMNEAELEALIDDHYLGEAQTLTSGAEQNLLKLKELRGVLGEAESERWEEIKRGFRRVQAMGGGDDDPVTRVTGTLGLLADHLGAIGRHIEQAGRGAGERVATPASADASSEVVLAPYLEKLHETLAAMGERGGAAVELPASVGFDAEAMAAVTQNLKALNVGLETIGRTIAQAAEARPGVPSGDGVRVVQTLQSGVYDIMDEMSETVDRGLMELLRSIARWMKHAGVAQDSRITDLMDRTLKNLDRLKDLLKALKKIDTSQLVRPEAGSEAASERS